MKVFEKTLAWAAALALFAMMLLTFCDVIGRKLLGWSIPGAVELTELIMLVVIFIALPLTSLHGQHVVFDVFDTVLPPRWRRWQHLAAHLLCTLLSGGAAWLVWVRAERTVEMGDRTAQLGIAIAPFHYMVALMLACSALMHALLALRVRRHGPVAATMPADH